MKLRIIDVAGVLSEHLGFFTYKSFAQNARYLKRQKRLLYLEKAAEKVVVPFTWLATCTIQNYRTGLELGH